MAFEQSEYKSSTAKERFSRQLDRDLARKSGRLSQSVIRALLADQTSQWAKSIYNQKLSQNSAANSSTQQTSQTFATTQTNESLPSSAVGGSMAVNDGAAGASSYGGGGGFQEEAIALKVGFCVDGIPKEYWMAVWDEEPEFE